MSINNDLCNSNLLEENNNELRFGRANHTTFLNIRDFEISEVDTNKHNSLENTEVYVAVLGYN